MCKFLTKLITAFKLTLAELSQPSLDSLASRFRDGGTQSTLVTTAYQQTYPYNSCNSLSLYCKDTNTCRRAE